MTMASPPTPPPITGGILAGGRGRRMGGVDKGLVTWRGRPLIEHVLAALRPQVLELLINANRNQAAYAGYGHPVVADRLDGFAGPLAGFAALLGCCDTDWLAVVPCDAPHLPRDLVARLDTARRRVDADIAVAHDGQRLQPVHVLLGRHLLPDLEAFLAAGERKIDRWYARHRMVTVDFGDCPAAFANLNTPEDHQRLEGEGP